MPETNLKDFDTIQAEVGLWSRRNFGSQTSKARIVPYSISDEIVHDVPIDLEELAPLLGIFEETGELFEEGTEADVKDALADILIYLCDFTSRFGLSMGRPRVHIQYDKLAGIVVFGAKMARCILKHHQGIRKFSDRAYTQGEVQNCVYCLIQCIHLYAIEQFECTALQLLNETWVKVSQRDWKSNPDTAAEGDLA